MKDLEQLVRYLDGDLNDAERNELIEKLKKDPSLREKLELIRDVDQILGDKHLENFEDSIREVEALHARKKSQPVSLRPLHRWLWPAAAAIFLIIISAASYFFFHKNAMNTGERLFAAYYEKLPADFSTRSGEISDINLENALKLYNQNEYQKAITEFRKVTGIQSSDDVAHLFLGICYVETNKENLAAKEFGKIMEHRNPALKDHVAWFLSLLYVKTGQESLARPLLQELVSSRSFYREKASGLLKKMQ